MLTKKQVWEEARKIAHMVAITEINEYIKIGRVCKMEIKIDLEVQKVENGFILFKEVQGVRNLVVEDRREVYLTFKDAQVRIVELLGFIADDLNDKIAEAIPEKK